MAASVFLSIVCIVAFAFLAVWILLAPAGRLQGFLRQGEKQSGFGAASSAPGASGASGISGTVGASGIVGAAGASSAASASSAAGVFYLYAKRLFRFLARQPFASSLLQVKGWERARQEMYRHLRAMVEHTHSTVSFSASDALGALLALSGASGLLCFLVSLNPFFFLLGCALGIAALSFWGLALSKKDKLALTQEVPQIFRMLSGALSAGQTLTQAVSYVGARGKGRIAEAFSEAALKIHCGGNPAEALDDIAKTIDVPSLALLSCVLQISQRTGAPLASLLENSAQMVEAQGDLRQLLNTKTAQVRFSAQIVMFLPIALVVLLALITPDFREGLMSPGGFVSLCVAAFLDAIAFISMRKIMAEISF